ncbi:MAG: hypothetical protein EOO04_05020 [Chitinophagaceae bacterium]|nr:MAG: hypothetical protein EOO04_05020 [Chitinophagaceae bacterium]
MKKSMETMKYKLMFFLFAMMNATILLAQDGGGDGGTSVTVSKSTTSSSTTMSEDWYTSPWVWIVGAAVFILLLIALVRGGGRSEVHKTTVRKDVSTD